ncbi:MAG: hypothetical protein JWN23_933 [Rhodocyclales bacterium]|nr:hypothetical protein [Rhodocyclales bacterium]
MRNVVVRYKVKPECVAENVALIHEVFEELAHVKPAQVRYDAYKLPDGVSFVHVVATAASAEESPLLKLASFQRFLADIKSRVEEAPVTNDTHPIGHFDSFA